MLKILDYGELYHFSGIIGRSRRLAWPVHAYRITLPRVINDGNELNAFERVILKLLDSSGAMNAEEMADETRIPLDLVKGIFLRLQDKGYIDEYNTIIRQRHDDDIIKKDNAQVFVTALLFRELATGKVLPFLHLLDDRNPLKKKVGEEKDFRTIHRDSSHRKKVPTQRDVINTLRAMKKRAAAFGMEYKMPSIQQITIIYEPELYHLDCPIVFQKGDGEYRVSDPFGNGFSLILEKSFEQLLEQDDELAKWLHDWKQRLISSSSKNREISLKEPFDTDTNSQRYPKLVASLRPASNARFRTLAQIHASIEWALFYACCLRPFNEVIVKLKQTEQSQHAILLEQAAQSIGLEPPSQGFRHVREGKLRDFEDGAAYLETVLAIAILQARDDAEHPLRHLAAAHPDLINRLIAISVKRNEKAHGRGGADAAQHELSDDHFLREVVHTLVQEIEFTDTPTIVADKDLHGDALLAARANIQGEFGFKLFNRLGTHLQNRLIHAERFFISCIDGDDAMTYVSDLYAAAQASFENFLAGRLPPDASDTQLIGMAESKAVAADLCKVLPESLRTVKTLTVRQTLQGGSQSLGACVVALLLVSDEDVLAAIRDMHPTMVDDMSNLIIRRGHGNEPILLSKADIAKLRKATLSTIKTFLEL